jgi:O-antigen/teichoic acid export membrane protein
MKNHSYKEILKSTSIFGGVQIFQIITQILRSKVIALLIGPAGIGLAGLFNNAISLIVGFTSLGLGSSSVKDISFTNENFGFEKVNKITTVVKNFLLLTGIIGALFTALFSKNLSEYFFGNIKYTTSFIWISISVFFTQISSGQSAILQGLKKINYIAKGNLMGSLSGFLFSIPIYYFFKIEGILPAIILSSILTFLFLFIFTKKIGLTNSKISLNTLIIEGKSMVILGLALSISSLLSIFVSSVLRIYINKIGSLNDLGLYTAGFSIVGVYLSTIFNAMGMDYFPRLSTVANSKVEYTNLINQQAEIAIIIISPLLVFFFVFIDLGILVLYSELFLPSINMMIWASLGMFFKAATWPMGFLFLARSDSKEYFFNELFSNIYLLVFSFFLFKYYGITGLGVSYFLTYLFTFLQVVFILKVKYGFLYCLQTFKIFFIQLVFILLSIYCYLMFENNNRIIGLILFIFSLFFSFYELMKSFPENNFNKIINKFYDKK